MVNKKLQEIGKKLDITDKDIRNIGKVGFTTKIVYWIVTAIIAVISYIIGFFVGKGTCPSTGVVTTTTSIATTTTTIATTTSTTTTTIGYPYAAGLMIPSILAVKKRSSKIAILLVSAVAFLIAIKIYPIFGQAIMYNVYKRK
jgi:hypothetical protein